MKKYRLQHGNFIAEGPKIVSELADSELKITELFAVKSWLDNNADISEKVASIEIITEDELAKISSLSTPNQVLAVAEIPVRKFDLSLANNSMVIVLDEIRDPGNLGTIIRIADWFGIKHIVCSENCVDAYNSKTVQASMGSICRIPVYYEDVVNLFNRTSKNISKYGAFLDGTSVYEERFDHNGFLVIGNESNGISAEIEKLINKKISIPSGNKTGKHAESLNASIATAIICSEINRQKSQL
jgi:TrmH family RNA methyltransferase